MPRPPLALFHRPPSDTHATGTLLMGAASVPSLVVLNQDDEPYLAAMRAAGYSGDALQYVLSNQASGYCAGNCTPPGDGSWYPQTNQAAYQLADYATLSGTESSFLHTGTPAAPGNRIYAIQDYDVTAPIDPYSNQYTHAMKPDDATWLSFWATKTNLWFNNASRPYAGCFLDNVDCEYAANRFASGNHGNYTGTILEYPGVASGDHSAYKSAVVSGLATRHAAMPASKVGAGYRWANTLWGNVTTPEPPTTNDEWSALRASLDGFMLESFALNWSTPSTLASWRSQATTEVQMANITAWLNAGKKVIAVVQGNFSTDPDPNQNFALCLFWQIYQPGAYFRWSPDAGSGYRSWRHYQNYLTDVGTSLGAAVKTGGTLWTREFSLATVTADFATHIGTITPKTGGGAAVRTSRGASSHTGRHSRTTTVEPVDVVPPVISNLGQVGATITWATNEAADSRVDYGTSPGVYTVSTPITDTSPRVTAHSVTLSGLLDSTTYNYRVRSVDAAGNVGLSTESSFTTATPSVPIDPSWLYLNHFAVDAASLPPGQVQEAPGGTGGSQALVVDSATKLSRSGGQLVLAGGLGSPAWGDPLLSAPAAFSRSGGYGMFFSVRPHPTAAGSAYVGVDSDGVGTPSQGAVGWSEDTLRVFASNANGVSADNPTFANWLGRLRGYGGVFAIVPRTTTGFVVLARRPGLNGWTVLWPDISRGTAANLWATISNYNGVGGVDALGVLPMGSPWSTSAGIATDLSSPGTASAQATNGSSDGWAVCQWTPAASSNSKRIYFRSPASPDTDNCLVLELNASGATNPNTARLYKRVGGVETLLGSAAQTFTAATQYTVHVHYVGTLVEAYVDCARLLSVTQTYAQGGWRVRFGQSAAGNGSLANCMLFPELTSVPLAAESFKDTVSVVVDTGQADPDRANSSWRPGIVPVQNAPDQNIGTSTPRGRTNTAVAQLSGAEALVHVGGFGVTRDISLSGTPTVFDQTANLDARIGWLYARGIRRITLLCYQAPAHMLAAAGVFPNLSSSTSDTKRVVDRAKVSQLATLMKNVLKRYVGVSRSLATQDDGSVSFNGALVTWKAIFWNELKGYGDTLNWEMPTYTSDWNAWYDAIRADGTLDAVELGGPYLIVEAVEGRKLHDNYTNLDLFMSGVGARTVDFLSFDHALMNSDDATLSREDVLRRAAEHARLAAHISARYGLPVYESERYVQSSVASETATNPNSASPMFNLPYSFTGRYHNVTQPQALQGQAYHDWVGCALVSQDYWAIKLGLRSGTVWGTNLDPNNGGSGNQQQWCQTLTTPTGDDGLYATGAPFPTHANIRLLHDHFISGTALKLAYCSDPKVLVLASATKTFLLNQHAYAVAVRHVRDGSATTLTLPAHGAVIVS